jgi:hypothetical protein
MGAQEIPSEVAALAAKARLNGRVAAWCPAEFRSGQKGAVAVAVMSAASRGRYIALDSDGRVAELASFERTADLSCFSRGQAEALDVSIREAAIIHGHITPLWNTTVVCGFTDNTTAVCWQYSPADQAFVRVGHWIT